jgi:hypothetical protein
MHALDNLARSLYNVPVRKRRSIAYQAVVLIVLYGDFLMMQEILAS